MPRELRRLRRSRQDLRHPLSHHGSAGTPCYVRGYWHDGIAALDEDGLRRPLGPKGGDFAGDPMAALIIHINREVMHHGGEICLLRDLYRSQG